MLSVFFSEQGYCVTGEGVGVARICHPALTSRGDRIFQHIHHTYKVLYLALKEVQSASVSEDVMVYASTRIIDEINGLVDPLDESCRQWVQCINRDLIPTIKPVVFFRKKSEEDVMKELTARQEEMIIHVDRRPVEAILEREKAAEREIELSKKQRAVKKLKERFFTWKK